MNFSNFSLQRTGSLAASPEEKGKFTTFELLWGKGFA
jgi:hypothetical protein